MKLLDRIAINSLIKTISNFILAIIKIFHPTESKSDPRRKQPIRDWLRRKKND